MGKFAWLVAASICLSEASFAGLGCGFFGLWHRAEEASDSAKFLEGLLQSPSALSSEVLSQKIAANGRERALFEQSMGRILDEISRGKVKSVDAKIEAIFAQLSPRLPLTRAAVEKEYFERLKFVEAVKRELQAQGRLKDAPGAAQLEAARRLAAATWNASTLWGSLETHLVFPFLRNLHISLDPVHDSEVSAMLELARREGWEKASEKFYRIVRSRSLFARDPIAWDLAFNRFVSLYNRRLVAIAALTLKVYLAQTAPNETVNDRRTQDFEDSQKRSQSENDRYFQEQLEAAGIDPATQPEEYAEAYRQFYGKDPPTDDRSGRVHP